MKTTLNVKAMYDELDQRNDQLTLLVEEITGKKPKVSTFFNEDYNHYSFVHKLVYDNHDELNQVISQFNDHRYIPFEKFLDVESDDFVLTLESENINESFNHLSEKNTRHLTEQINMIDYICSDIVNEQEDLSQKVDAIYGFIEKSGVLQYKQMIQAFISVLEEKQVISNKEEIFKRIFKEIH